VLELDPQDVDGMAQLGNLYFLDGQDERARSLVKAAKRLNAHHIETLLLEAALTRDVSARKVLYEKVLELDPVNEVAHANLKQMP
jgi:hypothetical protein